MNSQEQISPEIFEDIINNFIINNNSSIVNYIEVKDFKLEYDYMYEHYILDVIVYVKEGTLNEKGFKGVGNNIKWSSFQERLSQNKAFKNYLGLPLNDKYNNFNISLIGEIKEGFPKNKKITETKKLIKKILREEISSPIRRRLNFNDIERIINNRKIEKFLKNQDIEKSVHNTIHSVMYDIMPDGFEDDETKYYKVWDEIKKYLEDNYTEQLTQYFEKRQRDADEDKNPLGVKYIFIKHDKPYYNGGWRGFADGFDSFDDMITKYGNWVDVDWNEVKQKLDKIKDFPENTSTGRYNSRPLRISSIGDKGNGWGYNFSIIKSIPSENLDKINKIQTEGELTEKCWAGYTQKGMKTMFGKRYPNCVKKTKK
jgi:hypothetical protein